MARNILILTGTQLCHQWFCHQLSRNFPILAVFAESFRYPEPTPQSEQERIAWDWFFSRRRKYENKNFRTASEIQPENRPEIIPVSQGELNCPETLAKIKSFSPDLILVFGTSILGPELLKNYPQSILNLHVGLQQYYRGSSCNIWPIVNAELMCLGACVHRVDAGIDTGEILAQARIEMSRDDDEQDLAGKTLMLGTQLMISVVQKWDDKTFITPQENRKGKLYLMKDFTPAVTLKLKQLVESGELKKMIIRLLEKNSQ
jgi:methionyl-tRNA formyltransferase